MLDDGRLRLAVDDESIDDKDGDDVWTIVDWILGVVMTEMFG